MKGLFDEFKTFILRGNVVDLAVGVIIGATFGGIVTSLVNEIMMPPIGWAMSGVEFSELSIDLPGKMKDPKLKDKPKEEIEKIPEADRFVPVRLGYGKFIQKVIEFLITGFCLFLVIKAVNMMQRKKAEAPPEPTTSEKLLTEIRDALKGERPS